MLPYQQTILRQLEAIGPHHRVMMGRKGWMWIIQPIALWFWDLD